jgi:hypothetical protein
MKAMIPAKEVELCDVCEREETYFNTCLFCGARYCITCEAIIAGCIHKVRVCRKCGDLDEVKVIVDHFVPGLLRILDARDNALIKAGHAVVAAAGSVDAG